MGFLTVVREAASRLLFPSGGECVACADSACFGLCLACIEALSGLRLPADFQPPQARGSLASYRAAFSYRGCVRLALLAMKFRGETRPALRYLVPEVIISAREIVSVPDAVIPVPLSRERLMKRGYNQAALLAAPVARGVRIPLREGWLWRVRSTQAQSSLGRADRQANVRGAFRAAHAVSGKSILLLDDVLTSGATAEACAQALLSAGAARVDFLAVARAVSEEDL